MSTHVLTGPFRLAPDEALPDRDRLLDPVMVATDVACFLGRVARGATDACELVRAKYRIGESLRVVYRITGGAGSWMVSTRVTPAGGPVVWRVVPDDRKLARLPLLLRPDGPLRQMLGIDWVTSELVEFAPEKSATVRCFDGAGRVIAYAKLLPAVDVSELADRYTAVRSGLRSSRPQLRTPKVVGAVPSIGLLVLEPLPGRPWSQLPAPQRPKAFAMLGASLARVHELPTAGLRPFERLGPRRLESCCELIARARPDLARRCAVLSKRLAGTRPVDEPRVFLHGDAHAGNALFDDAAMALIDFDQAGVGEAAADVCSVTSRVRTEALTGRLGEPTADNCIEQFHSGYATVRPLPPVEHLDWYAAATLVAERGIRAVNRLNLRTLGALETILDEAIVLLKGDRP